MKIHEIKQSIINQLSELWKVDLINTRFDVVSFLIAYYGAISDLHIDAINILAAEGYIKF